MPLHYARRDKWAELLAKQQGYGNTPINVFYNEVLGESVDAGQKLVTETELRKASSLPWKNEPSRPSEQIKKRVKSFYDRYYGADPSWFGVTDAITHRPDRFATVPCVN